MIAQRVHTFDDLSTENTEISSPKKPFSVSDHVTQVYVDDISLPKNIA
jgi:hypothetical protein